MLRVFFGENRVAAEKEIRGLLGEGYEVFEGENLELTDLPSIFQGTSLLGGAFGGAGGDSEGFGGVGAGKRKILVKEAGENSAVWEKIVDYAETEHEVVVWETKIDKRSAGYKRLKEAGVEMREFPALKKPEMNLVFGILDTAFRDGKRAVEAVEKIETEQDPYMFFGLLVTQALKKYENSGARGFGGAFGGGTSGVGAREKRLLKELAKLDMQMKSTSIEPWTLVKGFLLRVSSL